MILVSKKQSGHRAKRFPSNLFSLRPLGLGLLALLVVGWPNEGHARPRHGVIWYVSASDPSYVGLAAKRYELGIAGREGAADVEKAEIHAQNPSFRWYVYNSGTDNYVPPRRDGLEEDNLLSSICAKHGWDPEIGYLHYRDDTRIVIEGDTLLIPGWGAGSAARPALARIPVYYKDLSRRVVNFSTPQSALLHRQVMVSLAFDTPFEGTNIYPDGIFLDNSAVNIYNYGTIVSGGHVREAAGNPSIESAQFRSWYWKQNLAPFLTSLKDTLESAASWSKNRQRKYLMINCSNAWDDSYVSGDVADVLFMEFQYNPVRSSGPDAIDEAYRRDMLASGAGIACFYSATMTSSVPQHTGEFTKEETMLGNLCWFLMTRTPLTVFYQQGTNTPNTSDWDQLTWIRAMDVADRQLGEAMGAPYTIAQGTDPLGNAYVVKARRYENGLVVLRNRGDWNQGIEPKTAVTVPLPAPLAPVSANGAIGKAVVEISLRNGQGALFLGSVP